MIAVVGRMTQVLRVRAALVALLAALVVGVVGVHPAAAAGWTTLRAMSNNSYTDVASVSRMYNTMEVFYEGSDGSIWDNYYYDGVGWRTFQLEPAGSMRQHGQIVAVSRAYTNMDVFWEAPDGSIGWASWSSTTGWCIGLAPVAPAGSLDSHGVSERQLAVVSRASDTIELWWIAPDGSVGDTYYYSESGGWVSTALTGPGNAGTRGGIAAVSRAWNTVEVWWVGADNSIQDANWYEGGTWNFYTVAPAGSAFYDASIAAVSRSAYTWEIFFTAPNGSIEDYYWYEGGPWGHFTLFAGDTMSTAVHPNLKAVARTGHNMDVFWVSGSGDYVGDESFSDGLGWSYTAILPHSNSASPADLVGSISAVSRWTNTIELWWFDVTASPTATGRYQDNGMQDSFIYF